MTARDDAFRTAVVDGGALGAAAIDVATRAVIAGHEHAGLVSPALLDLVLGVTRPSSALTWACGGPPPNAARELFVAGDTRALFCAVLPHGELIVVATPPTMGVALGWALVRVLAGTALRA